MFQTTKYTDDPKLIERLKKAYPADDHGNAVPTGFREITAEEFAKSYFFTYDPEATERRQFHPSPVTDATGKSPLCNAILYHYFDGTGIVMMQDYWAGKVRYFAFGCAHEYEHDSQKALDLCRERGITMYRCDHARLCTKCGHLMVVDSSD